MRGRAIRSTSSATSPTTSLRLNTITIDGEAGDDTIDISSLGSAHRIVFKSNGGNDTIIGALRAEDVIELTEGADLSTYDLTENANGTKTISNGTHSVTFTGVVPPQFLVDGPDEEPPVEEPPVEEPGNGDPTPPASGEVKLGTAGTDVLVGTAGDDTIVGLGGDDVAIGDAGADVISAGEGADLIRGGAGRDMIFAGAGDDQAFGGEQADVIYGDAGADRSVRRRRQRPDHGRGGRRHRLRRRGRRPDRGRDRRRQRRLLR